MATNSSRSGRGKTSEFKAWLVRWEWAGEHAEVDEPIIAILAPQLGAEIVRQFVERHYTAVVYSPIEKLGLLRKLSKNPCPATFGSAPITFEDGRKRRVSWTGQIVCGDNPYIVASRVQRLRQDDPGNPVSRLSWVEEQPRHRDLSRKVKPV